MPALLRASRGRDTPSSARLNANVDDNLAYGAIPAEAIADMARKSIAGGGVQAVVFFCNNVHGASAVPGLEAETGLPMIDSTAAGAWALLRAAGIDTAPLDRFGRIFTA